MLLGDTLLPLHINAPYQILKDRIEADAVHQYIGQCDRIGSLPCEAAFTLIDLATGCSASP